MAGAFPSQEPLWRAPSPHKDIHGGLLPLTRTRMAGSCPSQGHPCRAPSSHKDHYGGLLPLTGTSMAGASVPPAPGPGTISARSPGQERGGPAGRARRSGRQAGPRAGHGGGSVRAVPGEEEEGGRQREVRIPPLFLPWKIFRAISLSSILLPEGT